MKWRDVVSYKGHVLQSYSRVVSRAVQLVCQCLYSETDSLGFPAMLGVRDQVQVAARL